MWCRIPLRRACGTNLERTCVPTYPVGGEFAQISTKLTVCVVMMCLFFSLWNRATPFIAILLVSVAPEVKTMSLASAPIKFAICYRIWVLEWHQPIRPHLAGILNGLFGLPTIRMGSTMWIAVLIREVGQHCVQNTGIYWSCSLNIMRTREPEKMIQHTCMSK